jgi:hypothetical protein
VKNKELPQVVEMKGVLKDDPPQEWTAEMIEATLKDRPFAASTIASRHNAELAAIKWQLGEADEMYRLLKKQLATERERVRFLEKHMADPCFEKGCQLAAEREKYADTEADGIVFCGKCGAKL